MTFNKIKNNKTLALITALILSISIVASSMIFIMTFIPETSPIINAHAYNSTNGEFSGNENSKSVSDFNYNYKTQVEFKAYSVFMSMGMKKEQAVGILACIKKLSDFRSEIISGKSYNGLDGSDGSEQLRENYIDKYSKFFLDAKTRTEYTDDILKSKGVSDDDLKKIHTPGSQPSTVNCSNGNITVSNYYSNKGIGYPEAGLIKFDIKNLPRLFDFGNENKLYWYGEDLQLCYLITDKTLGGFSYKTLSIKDYISSTKKLGVKDCANTFYTKVLGRTSSQDVKDYAEELLGHFPKEGYDSNYGKKVLSITGEYEPVEWSDGIIDEGIIQHYANATVLYPQNCGYLLEITKNDQLNEHNQDVFKEYVYSLSGSSGYTSSTYSLFELYGEDVNWYRYFGESTYAPQLLDHIWSAIDQNKTNKLLENPIETITYSAHNWLSCQVYPNRPAVLTQKDVDDGNEDPRVFALSNGIFTGFDYVLGSFQMKIAKGIVSIIAFLAGPTIYEFIYDTLENIESDSHWSGIATVIYIVVGLVMVAFIISMVKKAIKYAKGTGSAREVINRFIIGVLCLGIVGACAANPSILNATLKNVVGVVDTIFNAALSKDMSSDEVCSVSNDETQAIHAAIWKTAIFNAWCRGQFDGKNYNELYTQYATLDSGQSRMEQSHQTPDAVAGHEDDPYYDSASLTGDVGVPVGGGKIIRNWAAYLYSCGTKYHIDSTLDKDTATKIDLNHNIYFPNATLVTTANDPNIEADLFRIIDAQMDISPQYYVSGTEINNYKEAHELHNHFFLESFAMIVNALLLLFLVPIIFKKMMSYIMFMITVVKMIFYSILELVKEETGLKELGKSLKKHFFEYLMNCVKLYTMIILYTKLVDQGFFKAAIYCILCLVILSFKLTDARRAVHKVKSTVNQIKSKGHI